MTRNRFNQAKQASSNTSLSSSKARQLTLEDNDNIDMKDTYKITNIHPPIDEQDAVSKKFCVSNLLSSSNKINILSKNITELRKIELDKVKTKTIKLNKKQVNDELINEFIKSANEVKSALKFCNKIASDNISKYYQLKLEFDNSKV